MFNKYYFHAIDPQIDVLDSPKILEKLEKILQSQNIYSRRLSNTINPERNGFNGNDFVSLCDYSKKDSPPFNDDEFYRGYTSYEAYVVSSLSILISKKGLKVIHPILVRPTPFSFESLEEMRALGLHPTKRFTDMPDEVQVKNKISLSHMEGLSIPTKFFVNLSSAQETKYLLTQVKELLTHYQYDKPIYDLDTTQIISKPTDIEKVLRKTK